MTTGPRPEAPQPDRAELGAVAAKAAQLRRLELLVTRRLDGLLSGEFLGVLPGPGSEPAGARRYDAGDDARRIDWSLTARSLEPHVRTTEADRELETWVVADRSASLDFGTTQQEKRELVLAAVAAFGLLMVGGGNRLGVLVAGGSGVTRLGPVSTRKAVMTLLSQLYDTPRREASPGPDADLVGTLQALERLQRRRGQVIVVSDFLDGGDWATPLRRLAIRHQIVAVQVVDPRELELPAVGMLAVVDTETGRQLHVQTNSARLRRRYAAAARQRHDRIAGQLLAARADHLVLATDSDWLIEIVRFFGRRRRAQRHATFGLPAAFAGAAAAEPQPPAGRRSDARTVR